MKTILYIYTFLLFLYIIMGIYYILINIHSIKYFNKNYFNTLCFLLNIIIIGIQYINYNSFYNNKLKINDYNIIDYDGKINLIKIILASHLIILNFNYNDYNDINNNVIYYLVSLFVLFTLLFNYSLFHYNDNNDNKIYINKPINNINIQSNMDIKSSIV